MVIKIKSANKPIAYVLKSIISKHADGIPLSCDESHFLEWHQKSLGNPHLDSAAKYYLDHHTHPYSDGQSFLRHEAINKTSIKKLKARLKILLGERNKIVQIKLSPQQFHEFKNLNFSEMILFHGNQFLTGAPFFPGGIPHIVFFQWGNLFGVAKYVILAEERALRSNVLIYFEDMRERAIDVCVKDYKARYPEDFKHTPEKVEIKQPEQNYKSTFSTPTLSLSKNKESKDKD